MTDLSLQVGRVGAAGRSRRWAQGPGWLATGVLVAASVLLIAVPLVALAATALELGAPAFLATIATSGAAMWSSVWSSAAATLVAVGLGTAAAVLTERTDMPGRRWLRVGLLIAFIVPGYVAAIGWLAAYGPGGLLDDLLGFALPALVGPFGVVVVLAVEAVPVTYLVVAAGLASRAEPDLERAARSSGAGALEAFRTVTLPLLRPVLAAAAAIAFVMSMTSFGVPAVLGTPAGFTTATTRIYRDLAFSYEPDSFVRAIGLALVLAVVAAAVIALADVSLRNRRAVSSGAFGGPLTGTGRARSWSLRRGPAHARMALAKLGVGAIVWLGVLACVILPLLALVLTALSRAPGLAPAPQNWTLDNFAAVVDARLPSALANSLLLSGAAAGGVSLLAGLAVLAHRGVGTGAVGGVLGLTFAVPGSTLAIAVLLAYGVAARDTLLIILVAYLAKFWALGHLPLASGLAGLPPDLRHAARMCGADALTTTRTVVLPLMRPLVVAGALVVFMFGLHEVTMSSLLYGPGTATLGVSVLNLQQLGEPSLTAALALLLTLVVALATLPLAARGSALTRIGWRP